MVAWLNPMILVRLSMSKWSGWLCVMITALISANWSGLTKPSAKENLPGSNNNLKPSFSKSKQEWMYFVIFMNCVLSGGVKADFLDEIFNIERLGQVIISPATPVF